MKNLFIGLFLLMSLQSFSNSIDKQDLDVLDEIVYCVDIDVGITVDFQLQEVKTFNHSVRSSISFYSLIENRLLDTNIEKDYTYKIPIRLFELSNDVNLLNIGLRDFIPYYRKISHI